ncbi:MAG: hypothetical protein GY847_39855 [Proteobacteria bacterium]|nr:hypothetical protein [Pseudomonadota bacterium]
MDMHSRTQTKTATNIEKRFIFPHRAYRIFPSIRPRWLALELLGFIFPFTIAIYYGFPWMTLIACHNAYQLLSITFSVDFLVILSQSHIGQALHIIQSPGAYPTRDFAMINAIVALTIIILSPRIRKIPKAVGVWLAFIGFIHLISSAFFIVMPERFPYSVQTFSELYMKTEVSMWFMIPFLLAFSVVPLKTSRVRKLLLILIVLMMDIILGIVRYILFLYILGKFSFIYMALMFFAFGPLVDAMYMVVYYSLFVSYIAAELKEEKKLWNWLY